MFGFQLKDLKAFFDAGLIAEETGPIRETMPSGKWYRKQDADALVVGLLRLAKPYPPVNGLRLTLAVARLHGESNIWPKVLEAVLAGRIPVYRYRVPEGTFIASFFVESIESVVAGLGDENVSTRRDRNQSRFGQG
jgi:hypothetical protein